ncbi:MAG: response regulator [Melioribacteraceae bacterium]|jgi:CheY-like chemotaxis protein|nr:response regulator [Melioribacteraceae bacterium]
MKKRLLLVEDDKNTQNIYRKMFALHFKVEVCDNDEEFYKLLKKFKFDIIIMDISLKGFKDGLQLTKEIKSNPDYKNIPVICLTAHAFPQDRENAFEAGVDEFLTKPVEASRLIQILLNAAVKKT